MIGEVEYNSILLLVSVHDGVDDEIVVKGSIVVGCQNFSLMFRTLLIVFSVELLVIMRIALFKLLVLSHKMIENDVLSSSLGRFFSYQSSVTPIGFLFIL